jgi:prephenate dehydrogenase
VGAFGGLMVEHLRPFFPLYLHDSMRDLKDFLGDSSAKGQPVVAADLAQICQCDLIVLATPLSQFQAIADQMAKLMAVPDQNRPAPLVMDVASVKMVPTSILRNALPAWVDVVSLHPLFGPQSGKNGIAGLNITVCEVRGGRAPAVAEFLSRQLALNVIETTPEAHDQELAYVQGLTHMIANVFVRLELPAFQQTTKTFELLRAMVEMVPYDSIELFRTIERDNPFMPATKQRFFEAVRELEAFLAEKN